MAQGSSVILNGHEIPSRCLVGDFELLLAELTAGELDQRTGVFRGVAGTAWLRLPCARPPIYGPALEHPDVMRLTHAVEVVEEVLHSQTEIRITDAQRFRPEAKVGDTVSLGIDLDRTDLGAVVALGRGVPDWLSTVPRSSGFPVVFTNVTLSVEKGGLGSRILEGEVTYPAAGAFRRPIEITIDGFTVTLSSLELWPTRARAADRSQGCH